MLQKFPPSTHHSPAPLHKTEANILARASLTRLLLMVELLHPRLERLEGEGNVSFSHSRRAGDMKPGRLPGEGRGGDGNLIKANRDQRQEPYTQSGRGRVWAPQGRTQGLVTASMGPDS